MRVQLMTFRYSASLGGFDTTPLDNFLRDNEVIAFREHFYMVNEVPHVTCIVHVQEAVIPSAVQTVARETTPRAARESDRSRAPASRRRGQAPDPCEGLDETERALFNHLREWRARTAREEGVPPYVVFTNKQFVALVRSRPDSLTGLGHIDGVGPAKIERYGQAMLACLHGAPSPAGGEAAAADGADGVSEEISEEATVPKEASI